MKLVAAVGASRAVAPNIAQADAAKMLAEPAVVPATAWNDEITVLDHVNFAENAFGELSNGLDP
jgi:hypothetical protein